MLRTRYTDEEKTRINREFEGSGGSAAAFCRQAEISYQTLMNWRRRTHGSLPSTTEPPAFLEFELGGAHQRPRPAGPLVELELGGDMIYASILPNHDLHPQRQGLPANPPLRSAQKLRKPPSVRRWKVGKLERPRSMGRFRQDRGMSRTRHSDEEKARIIREFEKSGGSAAALCRQAQIFYQTIMNWRRRTHGSLPSTTEPPAFLESRLKPATFAAST